jgi:hypothetical protein
LPENVRQGFTKIVAGQFRRRGAGGKIGGHRAGLVEVTKGIGFATRGWPVDGCG